MTRDDWIKEAMRLADETALADCYLDRGAQENRGLRYLRRTSKNARAALFAHLNTLPEWPKEYERT